MLGVGVFVGLQVAMLLVFGARLAILEPVEDVGVAHLTVLLELGSDLSDLIAGRVDHARVEDGLQDPDLLRLRVPPGFWLRRSFFTSSHCFTFTN